MIFGQRIFLILTGQSRSGKRRSYRAFTIQRDSLQDVTSQVCKFASIKWDNVTGSLDLSEPYRWQDAAELEKKSGLKVTII